MYKYRCNVAMTLLLRCVIHGRLSFSCIHDNIFIVGKVFKNDMVIAEFNEFLTKIEDVFEETKNVPTGEVGCPPGPFY